MTVKPIITNQFVPKIAKFIIASYFFHLDLKKIKTEMLKAFSAKYWRILLGTFQIGLRHWS